MNDFSSPGQSAVASKGDSAVDVLVIGAGPTGLTLACDLARNGIRVRICEKAPKPFHGSRGKGLQPRTLEVFEDLGVLDRVFAAGGEYPRLRVHVGPLAFPWDMIEREKPSPDVPYANVWMLPQARTEEILRARLRELGVEVEFAAELTNFSQDDSGVSATLHHGIESSPEGESTEVVRARYLVGADGGHSYVRQRLGVSFEGARVELKGAIVGDVQPFLDGRPLDRRHWHVWPFAGGGAVALCPLPRMESDDFGSFQLFAQIGNGFDGELTAESVGAFVARSIGRSSFVLRSASWLSRYRPNVRLVDRYRVGRVFLAGDAAHVHPPTGGQGLNAGVQDAYNLGWKLGAVLAGAPDSLLDTYEFERRPVAADILGMSARLYSKRVQKRGQDTKQLRTKYRESAIARELRENPRGPRAGERAPDAHIVDATGRPRRLFDVFRGSGATLLAFGAEAVRFSQSSLASTGHGVGDDRATKMIDRNVFRDIAIMPLVGVSAGEARRSYGIDRDALVLVRPDGYIGMACSLDNMP